MTETRSSDTSTGFEVPAFFAADHAVVENGKAYINGAFFNKIYQVGYPAQITIAVVALIKVPAEAYLQDHRFAIEMEDGRGNKLDFKIEGDFRVAPLPDSRPGEPAMMPIAVPLSGVILERADNYVFILSIDENEVARYEVRAVQVGIIMQPPLQAPSGDSSDSEEE